MTTAIILLAIITVKATFALECPGNPWVGVGAEISTSITANNVECGDKDQTKYCERRIAAVVENCGHCTASVLLQKSYSLLGFVKCYSETAEFGCRIEIQGSIEVGCCGSLLCRGKLIAQADSRISIGSLSSVDITILNIGSRGSLIVGDGVSLTGNYMAKYEIGDDSTFALYSTSGSSQFEFTDSEIQTLDRNNFTYSGKNTRLHCIKYVIKIHLILIAINFMKQLKFNEFLHFH